MKKNRLVGREARTVIEVLLHVGCQGDDWEAYVVMDGDEAWRAITFKGPALDFWLHKYLAALSDDPDDPNSKIEAKAFLQALKNGSAGDQSNYYKLKLDEEVLYLDNQPISNDESHIKRRFKRLDEAPPLFKGMKVPSVIAIWEIVVYDKKPKQVGDAMHGSAADLF